jgi:hydroxyacyl-ACP dehydratase HTD2-like protein with hotdog domain
MAVKREVYEKIGGFNPVINWGQDIDLSKRLKQHGKVKFDTDITVVTSFRRYSGGYDQKPIAMAHAVKELCVQLTRCYMVTKKGKVYSKTQKEIRVEE